MQNINESEETRVSSEIIREARPIYTPHTSVISEFKLPQICSI